MHIGNTYHLCRIFTLIQSLCKDGGFNEARVALMPIQRLTICVYS